MCILDTIPLKHLIKSEEACRKVFCCKHINRICQYEYSASYTKTFDLNDLMAMI